MVFRFGNQGTLESKHALVVPIGPLKLKIAIVPGQTPFLLLNTLLRAIGATVDIAGEVIKSTLLKRNIPIQLNAKGLFLVDLNDLITPTSQDAEAEPAETFATLNCKSLPSVSVQKPGQVQSETKTMMKQNVQVRTGLVTSRIQQFEAAMPESTKTHTNTKKPNERPSVRGGEKVSFESVPGGVQPGVIRFGFKTGSVQSHTCDHPIRSPAPHHYHADLRSSRSECPLGTCHGGSKEGRSPRSARSLQAPITGRNGPSQDRFRISPSRSDLLGDVGRGGQVCEVVPGKLPLVEQGQPSEVHPLHLTEGDLCRAPTGSEQSRPAAITKSEATSSGAKAKPIQEVTPQDLADLAEDESWEPVQEIEIQPEIYTEMAAMDTRLQTIDGAMQEIIAHLLAS